MNNRIPRSTADEASLFGALFMLTIWREAGSPKNVDMHTAVLALHTAARSSNPVIRARAAAELARLTP